MLKHCNALSEISLILGRISLTSQRELLVKDFPKPHVGIFWITSLKDKQKKKNTMMILFKAGKAVDNTQKLKFATLPFKTDIPQAVAFLVFLGIASSIRESMSVSDKSSNFESAEAMV